MAVNFADVILVEIPEGKVKKIQETTSKKVLWEMSSTPIELRIVNANKIKSLGNSKQLDFEYVYADGSTQSANDDVTINGVPPMSVWPNGFVDWDEDTRTFYNHPWPGYSSSGKPCSLYGYSKTYHGLFARLDIVG